jgi:hypothetical protein
MITTKFIVKDAQKVLGDMLKRERAMQSYFNRNLLEQYRNIQRKRWMTQGESEGSPWRALNPDYAARKKRVYASYPGGGTKMLIATNRLITGVVGPGGDFRKVTTPRSITLSTVTPYAKYVDEDRTFTKFGAKSLQEIYKGIGDFLFKGILKNV